MAMFSSQLRLAALLLAVASPAAHAVEAMPAGEPNTTTWWGAPGASAEDVTYHAVGDSDKGFYVGADFMYLQPDAGTGYPDNLMGGALFAGYRFSKYVAVELSYGRTTQETESTELFPGLPIDRKLQMQHAAVDVMGSLPVHERFSLLAGVGYGWMEQEREVEIFDESLTDSATDDGGVLRLTGGVAAKLTRDLSLRTTARYSMPELDNLEDFWTYNVGLQYQF